MPTYLNIGGLIAAGFDASGAYLLTISHSGRGVFSTRTWGRVARDYALAYPEGGEGEGIGPIAGERIPIVEMDYDTETLHLMSPDGQFVLDYESGMVAVTRTGKGP